MSKFWNFTKRYLFHYKWWYIAGFFLIAGTQALVVAIIETIKQAINAASGENSTATTIESFAISIVIFAVLLILIRTLSRHFIFTPGRMIEYRIRNEFFAKLLSLQRDFLANHETGDLVSRCSNDVTHIRVCYGFAALQTMNVTITFSFGFTGMLYMDVATTLYLAIPMIISFAIIQGSIFILFHHWKESNLRIGKLSSFCLSSYQGVSVIQNYHAEPVFQEKFASLNNGYLDTNLTINKLRSFVMPLVRVVGGMSLFIVLWVVGPKVISKDLTLGDITAFIGYIAMVMPPLLSLGWMVSVINRAIPAIERLDEILLETPSVLEVREKLENKPCSLIAKGLNFEHSKSSKDTSFALKNIHLKIEPGTILGIVGPTGSGKTTLVETILRLNALSPEQLFIQGKDVAYTDLVHFRSFFSAVPQQAFLFSNSLRENLAIALPQEETDREKLDEKLLHYLEISGFKTDLKQLPSGLDTQVGEKGVMLSGGQRQRVSLARALLRPAEFYILDDVLSAVDHETESLIIQNLRAIKRSFVIVSHRVSAVQWADEILVMEKGEIVDRGTHQELISREGFYKKIFEYQQEGSSS